MGDEAEAGHAPDVQAVDTTDPDVIAARPPDKAIDAKAHFQIGKHENMWSEFDERGVPTKNIKKKKPTKKEKDVLETEYLEASKAYQKYLKSVEDWEQSKIDAEKALKKSDRLRWSFRQVGEKQAPVEPDDMEAIMKLMGWVALTQQEFKVVRKGLLEIANSDNKVELETLRVYVRDVMPIQLLEQRLLCEQLDAIELEELYSPRTWRAKIEADPPPKGDRSPKGKKSPRNSGRGAATGTSPRGSTKKATGGGGGGSSARGKKSADAPGSKAKAKSKK